jgi:hypothetical protein
MIHCLQCIDRDTIPSGRKRWDERTLPNFDTRISVLKNKALLQPYKKKCVIKNNMRIVNRRTK